MVDHGVYIFMAGGAQAGGVTRLSDDVVALGTGLKESARGRRGPQGRVLILGGEQQDPDGLRRVGPLLAEDVPHLEQPLQHLASRVLTGVRIDLERRGLDAPPRGAAGRREREQQY